MDKDLLELKILIKELNNMHIPDGLLLKYCHQPFFEKAIQFDKLYKKINQKRKSNKQSNINVFISFKLKKGFSGFRKGNRILILRFWTNNWIYEVYGYNQLLKKKISKRVPRATLRQSVDFLSMKFLSKPDFRYHCDHYHDNPIEAASAEGFLFYSPFLDNEELINDAKKFYINLNKETLEKALEKKLL